MAEARSSYKVEVDTAYTIDHAAYAIHSSYSISTIDIL